MDTVYKLEKINSSARVMTPAGRKSAGIGYIYTCVDKADFDHKMRWESHHWKDITEYPEAKKAPKPKTAPKVKAKPKGKKEVK